MFEIAYRFHGESWKRKTFKTEGRMGAWLLAHDDDLAEVRWAS